MRSSGALRIVKEEYEETLDLLRIDAGSIAIVEHDLVRTVESLSLLNSSLIMKRAILFDSIVNIRGSLLVSCHT